MKTARSQLRNPNAFGILTGKRSFGTPEISSRDN